MMTKPSFFIIRPAVIQKSPDGTAVTYEKPIVPLIPADLIPEWVEIKGFPRRLSIGQTVGMTNLGSYAASDEVLRMRFINLQPAGVEGNAGFLDDHNDGCRGTVSPAGPEHPQHPVQHFDSEYSREHEYRQHLDRPKRHGYHLEEDHHSHHGQLHYNGNPQQHSAPENTRESKKYSITSSRGLETSRHNPEVVTQSASTTPVPGPTAYCKAWCQSGMCKYGISCDLKHEMPRTSKGLKNVGLDDLPLWWRAVGRDKKVMHVQSATIWQGQRRNKTFQQMRAHANLKALRRSLPRREFVQNVAGNVNVEDLAETARGLEIGSSSGGCSTQGGQKVKMEAEPSLLDL